MATKKSQTYFVTKASCPHCGYEMDAATSATDNDAAPEPGDAGICFNCAGIVVYADRFTFRAATQAEEASYLADERVQKVRTAIHSLRQKSERS